MNAGITGDPSPVFIKNGEAATFTCKTTSGILPLITPVISTIGPI